MGQFSRAPKGFNGKLLIVCPSDNKFVSLFKIKMSLGIIYKGLEFVAGCKIDDSDKF